MLKLFFRIFFLTFAMLTSVLNASAADEDVMIVLDASGSMWGQIDKKPKIEIAREVMGKVLTDLDGKAKIGVVTYGHRKKGDCGDIETIIPVGEVDRAAYMATINKLSPKGKTPITDAVRKAADELRYTEGKATIVLVSDGLETCQADPCALAKELESKGMDFTVHVIGFDLKNEDTASLRCLAEETGGKYLAADNADELGDAFATVVVQAPKVEPVAKPAPQPVAIPTSLKVDVLLAPGAPPIENAYVYVIAQSANKDKKRAEGKGGAHTPYKVQPGSYYLETKVGTAIGSADVDVLANQENHAEIILNAGLLSVKASQEEGGDPSKDAYIYVYEPTPGADGKRSRVTGANQREIFTLPAGKYYVTAQLGKAIVGREVEIVAGEKTDGLIVLASGLLHVSALAEEGGKPQKNAYIYVYECEQQTDGKRNRITGANTREKFILPAGKYYVTAQIGKAIVAKDIEIVAGKLTEETIVVGVGVMQANVVPAEGAKPLENAFVTVYEREKQIDGRRKQIDAGKPRTKFSLPAGEYYIIAKLDKAEAGQNIEVKAGKLTEMSINLNAGALSINANKKLYVTIFAADKNLDGTRDIIVSFAPRKPLMLPAGRYYLEGKEGDKVSQADVEIKAGKLTEIDMKP